MAENKEQAQQERPEFRMQKMYIKDLSFENPNAPMAFIEQQGEPSVEVNLQLNNKKISVDGGFVPFLMEPVNFMALYQNAQKRKEEEAEKDN